MKISAIGSCLSGSIIEKLVNNESLIFKKPIWNNLRSDLLLNILNGTAILLDRNSLISRVKESYNEKPNQKNRIEAQSKEKLTALLSRIKNTDVVLIDNNYEANFAVQFWIDQIQKWSSRHIFGLVEPKGSTGTRISPSLTPEESILNYKKIFVLLKEINPNIKIVFINFPVSGFKKANAQRKRIDYGIQFASSFSETDEQVYIVPLIDVSDSSLSTKGVYYFQEDIYSLLAEYINAIITKQIMPLDSSKLYTQQQLTNHLYPGRLSEGNHPYKNLPDRNFWRTAITNSFALSIKDIYKKRFEIAKIDKIVTCGSCFAQHIGIRLKLSGFNFYEVEKPAESLSITEQKKQGYGLYSARYGNIYTTRQLNELLEQAVNNTQLNEVWENNGRFYDPFRPNVIENGFDSKEQTISERSEHLKAVYKMLQTLDVFIFTLGLTESWYHEKFGYVYPICPGTSSGQFDSQVHKFKNLNFAENLKEMKDFYEHLMAINPRAKLILTISPVPLVATYENQHVLLSTIESKSILRAVAGEMVRLYKNVDYFPSYEIISSFPFKGLFYENNLRTIRREGVDFVMEHFFAEHKLTDSKSITPSEYDEAFCDEVLLDLV